MCITPTFGTKKNLNEQEERNNENKNNNATNEFLF